MSSEGEQQATAKPRIKVSKETTTKFMLYVERHNLHELFTELMELCFANRVENPKLFIANHLLATSFTALKEREQLEEEISLSQFNLNSLKTRIALLEHQLRVEREASQRASDMRGSFLSLRLGAEDSVSSHSQVTKGCKRDSSWHPSSQQ